MRAHARADNYAMRMPLKTLPPSNVLDMRGLRLWEQDILDLPASQMYPFGSLAGVDPVTDARPGLVSRATPIGVMGGCLISRMKQWLRDYAYNVVQTEGGVGSETCSARFGFVFNTGCARQCFERALGRFDPAERTWKYDGAWWGGTLVDPYRQGVAWADEAEAEAELSRHASAARLAVERSSVFMLSAARAEVWKSRVDGATFFGAPHPMAYDPARHTFVRTTVEENVANLEGAYAAMREINPSITLVVALSPVAHKSTPRGMHPVVADVLSKSILRVAIDAFVRNHPEVVYFPAFEIVREMVDHPFEIDNRHFLHEHVERLMVTFARNYASPSELAATPAPEPKPVAHGVSAA